MGTHSLCFLKVDGVGVNVHVGVRIRRLHFPLHGCDFFLWDLEDGAQGAKVLAGEPPHANNELGDQQHRNHEKTGEERREGHFGAKVDGFLHVVDDVVQAGVQ
jgi:hypothetical protein